MAQYSKSFTEVRRIEEAATPFVQAGAILDMSNNPERHFVDPEPVADVPNVPFWWMDFSFPFKF